MAEDKVKAVVDVREPESVSEVESFLGLMNDSGRFIPDLATLSELLRRLTKKVSEFKWDRPKLQLFRR